MPVPCLAGTRQRSVRRGPRTSLRAFERNSDALAEYRLDRLALEATAPAIGDLSGHAVEVDGLLPRDQLPCDPAGADAERVESLELGGKPFDARVDHHRSVIGLDHPGH